MRKFSLTFLVGLVAVLALAAGTAHALPAAPIIAQSWDEAVALSQQHGSPIVIDFYTDW